MSIAVAVFAATLVSLTNPSTTPSPITLAAKLAKQAKGVAKVQARCEALALKMHADLGFEEWYFDEAMVYQASECLATTIIKWFDKCENYCTSCTIARACEGSGNEECMWRDGSCHFGANIAGSFPMKFSLSGGTYSDFIAQTGLGRRRLTAAVASAQQILDEVFEPYPGIWAVLVSQTDSAAGGGVGVTIDATVFHTASDTTVAAAIDDLLQRIADAAEKWSRSSGSPITWVLVTTPPLELEVNGSPITSVIVTSTPPEVNATPPPEATINCDNANCGACGTQSECNQQTQCSFDGTPCAALSCSALDCAGCDTGVSPSTEADKENCEQVDECMWDDFGYPGSMCVVGCSIRNCGACGSDSEACNAASGCVWDGASYMCYPAGTTLPRPDVESFHLVIRLTHGSGYTYTEILANIGYDEAAVKDLIVEMLDPYPGIWAPASLISVTDGPSKQVIIVDAEIFHTDVTVQHLFDFNSGDTTIFRDNIGRKLGFDQPQEYDALAITAQYGCSNAACDQCTGGINAQADCIGHDKCIWHTYQDNGVEIALCQDAKCSAPDSCGDCNGVNGDELACRAAEYCKWENPSQCSKKCSPAACSLCTDPTGADCKNIRNCEWKSSSCYDRGHDR